MKYNAAFRLCLLIIGLAVLLSSCGQTATGKGNTGGDEKPESVTIEIEKPGHGPDQSRQRVTLHDARLVQQLYATIYALPQMPANIACTKELGPHYTLTFVQNQKPLVTVNARREGCRPVLIAGETHERRGSQEFWALLDKAIQQAAP